MVKRVRSSAAERNRQQAEVIMAAAGMMVDMIT